MHRSRWQERRTGFGALLLGTAMGLITNLVTGRPQGWPSQLQPLVSYAPAIGAGLLVAVGAKTLWDLRRTGAVRPQWQGGNPYPGLVAYTEQLAGVFFGRDREIAELLDRVRGARSADDRFVPVVGPSGSGKSSLVLAGLIPALRDGSGWRVAASFTPGTNVLGELSAVVGADLAAAAQAALVAALAGDPPPRLDAALRALTRLRAGERSLLLVVDQLEELVTQGVQRDRHGFLALVRALLVHEPRLRVVATVRSETIGVFQQGPGSDLFRMPLMVNVTGAREIRIVVREPARLSGTTFDDGLVEEIVHDAGGGDALPLLSYLLSDLYRTAAGDRHISRRDYEAGGGVPGAIARRADAAVRQLGTDGTDALERCLDTLLRFVTIGPGGATRQRVLASSLNADQRAVVRAFVEARLLTSDRSADGTDVVFDIAHEALLRQWQPLREHITRHEEGLRRLTELAPLARAWLRSGRQSDYLITGARLREALAWSRDRLALPAQVAEFLDEAERNQAGELERRADRAARAALGLVTDDPATAAAIAVAAYTELAPTPLAAAAMEAALTRGLVRVLPHDAGVSALAVSSDGRLATACGRRTVPMWSAAGDPLPPLTGHADGVSRLAAGPQGVLATAAGSAVHLWDRAGTAAGTLRCRRPVSALAYTPAGALLVGSTDGRLDRYSTDLTAQPALDCAGGGIYALACAPDGRVAAGLGDGTVWFCDRNFTRRRRLTGHRDAVLATAFGPDGTVATGSRDGTVILWTADGEPIRTLPRHATPIRSIAFAADGLLAVGDNAGQMRVWTTAGKPVHVLTEHRLAVRAIAFTAEGLLCTASADKTVRLWDLPGRLVRTVTLVHDSTGLAVAPDGRLAIGSERGPIHLYNADAATVAVPGPPAYALSVSADSALAAVRTDGTVCRWDPQVWTTPATVTPDVLDGDNHDVISLLFTTGGRLIGARADGTLTEWDRSGLPAHHRPGTGEQIIGLAALPDGTIVAADEGGEVRNTWTGTVLLAIGNQATLVAAGQDGRLAITRSNGEIQLQAPDAGTQTRLHAEGHPTALAIAPDGRLAVATLEGWIDPYDAHTRPLHRIDARPHLAFTGDGRLVTMTGEGLVQIWPYATAPEDLLAHAARHPRPALTAQQRETFLLPAAP